MEKSIKERTIELVKIKGLTMRAFEEMCHLSTGYVTSMRKGFGSDKLKNVLTAFPDLNRDWLLYGEGEMLKPTYTQNVHGGKNFTQTGDVNAIPVETLNKALDEITEQRKLVEKSQEQLSKAQEQMDRLLAIVERMNN